MKARQQRVPFTRPVFVTIPGHPERPRRLLSGNVSEGGMFVRSNAQPAPGTQVALSLEARGHVLPFAEGEVVWSSDPESAARAGRIPGFGVRFVRFLHPRSSDLIDYLVHRRATLLPPELANQVIPELRATALAEPITHVAPATTVTLEQAPPPTPAPADPDPASRSWTAAMMLAFLLVVAVGLLWVVRRDAAPPVDPETAPEPAQAEATPASAPAVEAPVQAAGTEGASVPGVTAAQRPAKETPPAAAPAAVAPSPAEPAVPAPEPLALAGGAVTGVRLTSSGQRLSAALALAPGALVEKVFVLTAPDRVVVDLIGDSPKASARLDVQGHEGLSAIRVGARAHGARLVLDMTAPVASADFEDGALRIVLR